MEISLPELFQMEMDQLEQERLKDPDEVIWRFSPLDINEFDIMLHIAAGLAERDGIAARQPFRVISFVEAGCGIGTKLYLAKHKYNMMEYGYEINPEYIAKCHELDVKAELRDLSADPVPTWAAYDIVYTCRPFKDDVFNKKWEKSVQDAMRPGAVLIGAFIAHKPYDWPCYLRRPFRGVWFKPDPGDLMRRAEAKAKVLGIARELADFPA
jgi:SAM-dependent methyltransferase